MNPKRELAIFAALASVFLLAYFVPLPAADPAAGPQPLLQAAKLLQWYARHHTLACVVPALFIAGAITTFLSQAAVVRHLGPQSPKRVAYPVASVSGTVLAVCSCSVLPMFAGIYRIGAGLGPATAFLYAGPAINVLAIFLTARVLGLEIGAARAVGAIAFAVLIGLGMAAVFRKEEARKAAAARALPEPPPPARPLWKNALFLVAMVAFLVFSDWTAPGDAVVHLQDGREVPGVVLEQTADEVKVQVRDAAEGVRAGDVVALPRSEVREIAMVGSWATDVWRIRWLIAGLIGLGVVFLAWRWFSRDELGEWMGST